MYLSILSYPILSYLILSSRAFCARLTANLGALPCRDNLQKQLKLDDPFRKVWGSLKAYPSTEEVSESGADCIPSVVAPPLTPIPVRGTSHSVLCLFVPRAQKQGTGAESGTGCCLVLNTFNLHLISALANPSSSGPSLNAARYDACSTWKSSELTLEPWLNTEGPTST